MGPRPPGEPPLPQPPPQGGVGGERTPGLGEARHVSGGDQEPAGSVLHRFRNASRPRPQRGKAGRGRFQEHDPEPFHVVPVAAVAGWGDEDVRRAVETGKILVRNRAEELHAVRDPLGLRLPAPGSDRAVARHHQPHPRIQCRQGREEILQSLARHQPSHEQGNDHVFFPAPFPPQGLAFLGGAAILPASNDVPHEEKGYQSSGYALSDYETINLANGNLTFRVPLTTLRTDGGLEYALAAHFNSKLWFTRRYCSFDNASYHNCLLETESGPWYGDILQADIAMGVEAFGLGWDLRPPHIAFARPPSEDYPEALVDASGARHLLHGDPPWVGNSRVVETPPGVGADLFTGDGTNYRFTVEAVEGDKATRIRMENGRGEVYIFDHIVPETCDADLSGLDTDSDLRDINFRYGVSGLYLGEIQRGPWDSDGVPANRITFTYEATVPSWSSACSTGTDAAYLPSAMTASGSPARSITFDYIEITVTDPGSGDDLTRTVGVLDSITVPVFNPVLGGTTVSTEDIAWNTSQVSFEQINGTPDDRLPFTAVHLDAIEYPTGESFEFDQGLTPPYLPLSRVGLPSGATVDYTSERAWPVGSVLMDCRNRGILAMSRGFVSWLQLT